MGVAVNEKTQRALRALIWTLVILLWVPCFAAVAAGITVGIAVLAARP
jgi:hypothetical protein